MSASEKAAEKVAQTKATTNGQVKATGAALKETTAPVSILDQRFREL